MKSLFVRPSWVCIKLIGGDAISAILLEEVFYRSNATIFKNDGNPVVVFSYAEWGNLTGLSINQCRKALGRLSKSGAVKHYNKKHPFKAALRALHVEVPAELHELYRQITSLGYRFQDGQLLYEIAGKDKPSLVGIIPPQLGGYSESLPNTPVCAASTPPTISIKENKQKESASSSTTADSWHEPESSLSQVKNLPFLLADLFEHYTRTTKIAANKKLNFKAAEIAEVWKNAIYAAYGAYASKPLSPKDYGILDFMLQSMGNDMLTKLIQEVIPNWDKFVKCVYDLTPAVTTPKGPDIGFLYYYAQHGVHLYLYKLKSYSKWQ